jgi:hypothetical protein
MFLALPDFTAIGSEMIRWNRDQWESNEFCYLDIWALSVYGLLCPVFAQCLCRPLIYASSKSEAERVRCA